MHRLALALGKTVRELQLTLTSREITAWRAYYLVEPFGHHADNYRSSIVCKSVFNAQGGDKVRLSDFNMAPWRPRKQSPGQIMQTMQRWAQRG